MTSTSFAPRPKRAVPTTPSPERSQPTPGSAPTKARLASMCLCHRQPLPTWLNWGQRFGAAIASQLLGALSPLGRPLDRLSTSQPIWKPGSRNTSTFSTSSPNSPTSATTRYATAHGTAIAGALAALLGEPNGLPAAAQELAFLPTRLGGLGLYSATRTKEAAYWAAWAALLPVIHARAPALAQEFVTQLEHGPP